MAFKYPKNNDSYPFQAPDGKWLNSPSEAKKYSAKLDAKAAVKPVTNAKAATAPGSAKRNDDGDVKLTSQFKDSSGRNVTYDFAGQANTTVKPQDKLKEDLQTGPQMVNINGKQTVVIPEGMQNNPGVPTAELKYDATLGAYTVPAGGPNGFMTAHPQTPNFSPQLAFALATLGLGGVVAPAVLAGAGAEAGGAGFAGAAEGAGGAGGLSGLGGTGYGQAGSLLGDAMQGFTAADAAAGANALGVGAVPGVAPAAGGFSAAQLTAAGINPSTAGLGGLGGLSSPVAPVTAPSITAPSIPSVPNSPIPASQAAIDGSAQSIYDAAANAGLPGYDATLTSGVAAGGNAGSTLAGPSVTNGSSGNLLSGAASAVSKFMPTGDPKLDEILKALLPAGIGYLGADAQADAMKDIYNQTRADRMPALNAYNTALQNPDTFYQSAPAMGAVDAVLRKLSVNGNPAANPGSLSQAASYNLGGYNDYLRGLTPAAFGTANTEANISMQGAGADAGKYNAVGWGLNQFMNPQPDYTQSLNKLALAIGGMKL